MLTYGLLSNSTRVSQEARTLNKAVNNLVDNHYDDKRVRALRLLQNDARMEACGALFLTRPIYTEDALEEYIQIAENENDTEEKKEVVMSLFYMRLCVIQYVPIYVLQDLPLALSRPKRTCTLKGKGVKGESEEEEGAMEESDEGEKGCVVMWC